MVSLVGPKNTITVFVAHHPFMLLHPLSMSIIKMSTNDALPKINDNDDTLPT